MTDKMLNNGGLKTIVDGGLQSMTNKERLNKNFDAISHGLENLLSITNQNRVLINALCECLHEMFPHADGIIDKHMSRALSTIEESHPIKTVDRKEENKMAMAEFVRKIKEGAKNEQ